MKWKDVKEIISGMNAEELEQDAIVVGEDFTITSSIQELKRADDEMLIGDGDDDITPLSDIDEEEISDYDHYYSKGHFIAHF